jgi:hypothetical protein
MLNEYQRGRSSAVHFQGHFEATTADGGQSTIGKLL